MKLQEAEKKSYARNVQMIYNVQKQQRWDLGEDLIILLESTEPRGILHDNRRILNWR